MVHHICPECDRHFTKTEHYKRHQRSHTKERPYECTICHKSFSRSDVLYRHTKLHTDDPHNDAGASSTTSDSLPANRSMMESPRNERPTPTIVPAKRPAEIDSQALQVNTQYAPMHPSLRTMNSNGMDGSFDALHSSMVSSSPMSTRPQPPLPQMMSQQMQQQLSHQLPPQMVVHQHMPQQMGAVPQMAQMQPQMPPQMPPQPVMPTLSRAATNPAMPNDNGPMLAPAQPQMTSMESVAASTPHQSNHNTSLMDTTFDLSQFDGNANDMLQYWLNQADNDIDLSMIPASTFSGPLQYSRAPSSYHSPPPHARSESGSIGSIPDARFARVEDVWRAKSASSHCFQNLWLQLAQSKAINVFCCDNNPDMAAPRGPHHGDTRWGLNSAIRNQLKSQFGTANPSTNGQDHARSKSHMMSNFPPAEVLDISLDIYFRRMAPMTPFIHEPTFSAAMTPPSLLFALCILGLSTTSSAGGTKFLKKAFLDLRRQALTDLVATASGATTLEERLSAYAITFLVLQLAIFSMDVDLVEQSQALHSMLLAVSNRQGLYMAPEAASAKFLQETTTVTQKWHAWARVESVRRLISCIITSDWWWGNNSCTNPIVHPESIALSLPADDDLFSARTAEDWWYLVQSGRNMDMPTIIPRSFHLKGAMDCVLMQPHPIQAFTMFSVLTVLKHMVSDCQHRYFAQVDDWNGLDRLVPWKAFRLDFRACSFVPNVVALAHPSVASRRQHNLNPALLWHNLNINLTCNLQIFELAAGRNGAVRGARALADVSEWCKLPAARRAAIHAAQTYRLLSNRKVSDTIASNCLSALFSAALVLALYIFQIPQTDPTSNGPSSTTFELMDDVEWTMIGDCGLTDPVTNPVQMYDAHQRSAVTDFINFGSPVTMNGLPSAGYVSARRVLLDFAHLMDEMGAWKPKMFSRILHIMSDVLEDTP